MLYLSECEVRRIFQQRYFDNKAQIEQVKDKHSRIDMCLLNKNKDPLLYIETKEQGKILDNNLNLQGEFQDDNLRSAMAQTILTNRQLEKIIKYYL